jgi:ATP-dependent Clp protease ATP-binding subunit ClpC
MQERFSDRARHAMALANLEATQLNHHFLAPSHLLLGLIAEGECVATEALRLLQVNLDRVRDEVRSGLKPGDGADQSFGRRAQTQETREVIATAINEARKFGHRYIGTEHLVLALLHKPDDLPARVLSGHGVNLNQLREKILGLLRTGVDPEHDLAHSRHGDFEWVHQQELSKAFRSAKFWHTMILAVDSANRLGAGEIEPEHLLLALLRDETNGVARLLEEKGVTADWVRQRVSSQLVANG